MHRRPIATSVQRNWLGSLFILAIIFFSPRTVLFAGAQGFPAPAGWSGSVADGNAVYQPNGLPPGRSFTMIIAQPQPLPSGRTIAAWFNERVQSDLERRGAQTKPGAPQTTPDGLLLTIVPFKDKAGESWTAVYAAQQRDSSVHLCSMISNLPLQQMKDYIRSGATIFGQSVKQSANVARAPDSGQPIASSAHREEGDSHPNGVSTSNIAGIVHEGRGMTTATGYQYVESVDLLLADGWAYSGLTGPPEDLDVEASKRSEPQKWRHWRQQGGAFYIEANRGWSKIDGDIVRPLEGGSRMSKNLVHRSAHTFVGMGGTVGTDRIAFYPNGRFERSANVLAGTGVVQASGGFSSGASSTTNRNGTASSSFGAYTGAGGSVTANSRSASGGGAGASTGTYKVSGYTLELDCANGQVQRLLAFYPFPGKPQIFIASVTFNAE